MIRSGVYLLENNVWGKGSLTGWNQNISVTSNKNGVLEALWTWDWLSSGNNVKTYAEVIYGQKPGSQISTVISLPKKVKEIAVAMANYDVISMHKGTGNTAFDLWLTDTKNPTIFGVPPITHEIMIWLEIYGDMHPAGSLFERAYIGGVAYNIFVAKNVGQGWKCITFQRVTSLIGIGHINFVSFFSYLRSMDLITGEEYLAAIGFGNEVIDGIGSTHLNSYSVSVH